LQNKKGWPFIWGHPKYFIYFFIEYPVVLSLETRVTIIAQVNILKSHNFAYPPFLRSQSIFNNGNIVLVRRSRASLNKDPVKQRRPRAFPFTQHPSGTGLPLSLYISLEVDRNRSNLSHDAEDLPSLSNAGGPLTIARKEM
jgi:hypothetical protein